MTDEEIQEKCSLWALNIIRDAPEDVPARDILRTLQTLRDSLITSIAKADVDEDEPLGIMLVCLGGQQH